MDRPRLSEETLTELIEFADSMYYPAVMALVDNLATMQEFAMLQYSISPSNPHSAQELVLIKARAEGARRLQSHLLTEMEKIRKSQSTGPVTGPSK